MAKPVSNLKAEFALLLATIVWGVSFALAKQAGEVLNFNSGARPGSPFGPTAVLALRFALATLLWLGVFPAARRGFNATSFKLGGLLGLVLGIGLAAQHLALDRVSEATTAFLTNLTIVFVPLTLAVLLRRSPPAILWAGVGVAILGVTLMWDRSGGGSGTGQALLVFAAFLFAVHIIYLNEWVPRDNPFRMLAMQFGIVAVVCAVIAAATAPASLHLRHFAVREVWLNTLLLTLFPTLISYGLMTFFQPKVSPTRAALIYLLEPIFAAGFALMFSGRGLPLWQWPGAGLLMSANLMVDVLPRVLKRSKRDEA